MGRGLVGGQRQKPLVQVIGHCQPWARWPRPHQGGRNTLEGSSTMLAVRTSAASWPFESVQNHVMCLSSLLVLQWIWEVTSFWKLRDKKTVTQGMTVIEHLSSSYAEIFIWGKGGGTGFVLKTFRGKCKVYLSMIKFLWQRIGLGWGVHAKNGPEQYHL